MFLLVKICLLPDKTMPAEFYTGFKKVHEDPLPGGSQNLDRLSHKQKYLVLIVH